jgi:hypothetical protein
MLQELHGEEFHGWLFTPTGPRMNKSERINRDGAVKNIQERKIRASYLRGNLKERCKLEDPGVGGSVL